jgi:hypothetical protein
MPQYFVQERISERISETPQGFLLCEEVPIARTGTQEYLAREIGLDSLPPQTVVTVDRLEADVMDAAVLASFEGATITLGHPSGSFVTSDNWRNLAMGHLCNVRRGTDEQSHLIIADMLITDPSTIMQVKGGLREVSCGYDCQYVQDDAGNWRQTNIRGNHVAIVPRGRAGAECSIKDSIMSRVADKIRSIWARATDEAAAIVTAGEAEAAAATPTPVVVKDGEGFAGLAVDAAGKVTIAADADMSAIVADMSERLAYMERAKKETDTMVDALKTAIAKLTEGDPEAAAEDAKPVALDALTIARAEILAPGIAKTEGVQAAAVLAAYATDDGKTVINLLTAGQAPTADTAAALFVPAAELLKASRSTALATPARDAAVTPARVIDATAYINERAAVMFPLS